MRTVKLKTLFVLSFCILLFSRIAVLTGNYNIPINPVMIEVVYIVIILILIGMKGIEWRGIKSINNNVIILLLFAHTCLFGVVLVNPQMPILINSQFKSQIVFVIIIAVTVMAIEYFDALIEFAKTAYYTLAFFLFIQFITHLGDININNIVNIMSIEDRTRSNFGFGHYNTLGAACLCIIILTIFLHEKEKKRIVNILILGMAIIMLLCSASRNSLTGFIVFVIVCIIQSLDSSNMGARKKSGIKCILIMVIVMMVPFVMGLDFNNLLKISQRSLIFYVAFPTYVNSGRLFTGLGYASNTSYGSNMTPYMTYWLDNSYMYYLIATGIIGFALIVLALIILGKRIIRNRFLYKGHIICSLYFVYLYTALFEVIIFESGSLLNYIYMPIMISFAMRKKYEMSTKRI